MFTLKSNAFRTREELCEFVNAKEAETEAKLEIVSIVTTSTMFTLFYRECE